MTVHVDTTKCCTYVPSCGCGCSCGGAKDTKDDCKKCVDICPEGAITQNKGIVIDDVLCTECGLCVDICCKGALSLN